MVMQAVGMSFSKIVLLSEADNLNRSRKLDFFGKLEQFLFTFREVAGTSGFSSLLLSVALSVGDWFFDRVGVSAIDCPYPYDNTCHNLVSKQVCTYYENVEVTSMSAGLRDPRSSSPRGLGVRASTVRSSASLPSED
ncbi:hypothetical protein Syun_001258 [Stephania yunnanensis]|uniref:Uncharacterized protein n=1 Tax=Stephania yunnanensis TaxID=152371 RepID=A0AAP0Q6X8_9MAGN